MSQDEKQGVGGAVAAVTELVKAVPVYQDAIQPAAKEVGQGLETIARAVNMALAPLGAIVWGYQKIKAFVEERVAHKLRDVPPDRIRPPNPNVAGPALEALRYTGHDEDLREMYANLLAATLDAATAKTAHPAFVDIIKNMAPDEAKIMRLFAASNINPLIDVRRHLSAPSGYVILIRNYGRLGEKAGCNHPDLLGAYVDNLCRLGLLEIPHGISLSDGQRYAELENSDEVLAIKSDPNPVGSSVSCERKAIQLTTFGEQFCAACVLEKPSEPASSGGAAAQSAVAADGAAPRR